MPQSTIARRDGSCSSGKGPARRGDCWEPRGGYKRLRAPSMAAPWVLFCAVCVLRVVLATVYFQEEFLDGGEKATPWWWGRKLPDSLPPDGGPESRLAPGWLWRRPEGPPHPALTMCFPPQSAGGTDGCSPPMTPNSGILDCRQGSFMAIKRKTKVSLGVQRKSS